MSTENNKRVVQIEIDDQVKKLTVEGVDKDAQVVMKQELSDKELDSVAGGECGAHKPPHFPKIPR